MPVYYLDQNKWFPDVKEAADHGLLAIGGDLSADRLKLAYASGIFPWFSKNDPICWHAPDPRCVLYPAKLRVSKSTRKLIDKKLFKVSVNRSFEDVIRSCAQIERVDQDGTWITEEMLAAYCELNRLLCAHSIEVWLGNELVGGLYGVVVNKCFFGESMFAKVSNASKVGFVVLVEWLRSEGFLLIDCQTPTNHLVSMGAELISRNQFMLVLEENEEKCSETNFESRFLVD